MRRSPPRSTRSAANTALRVYAIFLSLVGAAIVAVVYAFITDALIRSRLLQTLGRRTIPAGIHDHVIVAGLGSIGYRVALGIAARGVPVVAVEVSDDGRFVSPTRAAGIPVFIGDARHPEVLEQLHLDTARAIVAATSDDLVNLSAALNARALRPDLRVVVRLYDPDFAIRVQHGFKIRFTRSVSQLAAPAFAAAAIGSEVIATVPVGDKRVILFARLRVPAGSMLEGRLASSLGGVGALRILAVADPGSEDARWDLPGRRGHGRRRGGRRGGHAGRSRRPAPPRGDPRGRHARRAAGGTDVVVGLTEPIELAWPLCLRDVPRW